MFLFLKQIILQFLLANLGTSHFRKNLLHTFGLKYNHSSL